MLLLNQHKRKLKGDLMSVFNYLEGGSKLWENSTEDSIQITLVKLELCGRQEFG